MKQTSRRSAVFTAAVLMAVTLAGCSGNSSSSSGRQPVTPNYVNGYLGTANIRNAMVYAVPVNVQGQPGTELDKLNQQVYLGEVTSSDAQGYYRVRVAQQDIGKAMVLIVQGKEAGTTTAVCELTLGCADGWAYKQAKVVASDFSLTAAVGNVQNNTRININWLTHLAADHAYTSYIDEAGDQGNAPQTPKEGMFTPFTIERGNLWLSKQFEVADIISLRPIAPSQLAADSGLSQSLLEPGIRYGALVAAAQKLAKDEPQWLAKVVEQQRALQGQLYFNHDTEFSLCRLYGAAAEVLQSNRDQAGSAAPAAAEAAQQALNRRRATLCTDANKNKTSQIEVRVDEINGWVDRFKQAEEFLTDLNQRLLNFSGDDSKTCGVYTGDDCVNSFVDPAYVTKTVDYYDGLEALYRKVGPGLDIAVERLRDHALDFIRCLNGKNCVSGNFNAKTYSADGITLTVKGVLVGLDGEVAGQFNAFDVEITGTQTVNYVNGNGVNQTLSVAYKTVKNAGTNTENKARLRLVYNNAYTQPPLTAVDDGSGTLPAGYTEALGFDLEWPLVEITFGGEQETLDFYLAAKLIGVKDALEPTSLYHYNLTELSLRTRVQGAKLGSFNEQGVSGDLRNQAELTFSLKPNNAANYYSPTPWPRSADYFQAHEGFVADPDAPVMFSYRLRQDESVVLSATEADVTTEVLANYLEIETRGLGINRFELFTTDDQRVLRKCSIERDEGGLSLELKKICTSANSVEGDFDLIDDLINGEEDYLGLFAIPGRGAYKPDFPASISWGDGDVDGILRASFVQGLDQLNLRVAHELVDVVNNVATRAPRAIVNVRVNRPTVDNWEVAIAAGYDYDYLVDVLPTGTRAQSLYLSYLVRDLAGQGDKRFFTELGSLIVFRGGVKLFTDDEKGESIGVTLASRVDYELGEESTPCGYANRDQLVAVARSCDAVGYITFRNALVAVIREERSGVYVARFSNGRFIVLGV
ncbi:hypothetical protein GJQ54_06215 [Oceanospirillaceae bacterium ASx5O]|nr:hypothetical protein GJQ54_06215 [Oceanospirillaceae bacterium ASx5O]